MPILDVTYPQGALNDEQRESVAADLTTALLRAERAPDTDFFANVTWVYMHELPQTHVFAARKPVQEPRFRIDVTTPQGALSDRRREELVGEATRIVKEHAGLTDENAHVWVLCREIDEGSWGVAGQVIHFEQLRQAAAHEREKAEAAEAVTT